MSKEEFLSVYERQQASGLTIKDFCENEAYPMIRSFHWICVAGAIFRQAQVTT